MSCSYLQKLFLDWVTPTQTLTVLWHVTTVVLTISPFRSRIPHFVWPRNRYIIWPGRIFLIKLGFFLLKLCFPLKCFWIISFISSQSVVFDQIMAWQTLVPCISWFNSDNYYLFFCFFVSGYFVKGLKCLHMEWFILCCLLSLTQVSVTSESFHTLDRAEKSHMQVKSG